jgi:hypothetical protein
MEGSGITVDRWQRYGKDRLYVATSDGEKVGWWDLTTGEAYPESPAHAEQLNAAVADWKGDHALPAVTRIASDTSHSTAVPLAEPPSIDQKHHAAQSGSATVLGSALPGHPVPPGIEPDPEACLDVIESSTRITVGKSNRPWLDLAENRAGAEAREQAPTAREAAPVKSLHARALGVHTEERAWRIGAAGEEKVAAQLAKVAKKDPRWRFLHAIPVGDRGSDIDHLVIGPGGVFTVNAKHHPRAKIWVGGDTFMVNGNMQPLERGRSFDAGGGPRNGRGMETSPVTVAVGASRSVEGDPVHCDWATTVAQAQAVLRRAAKPDGLWALGQSV